MSENKDAPYVILKILQQGMQILKFFVFKWFLQFAYGSNLILFESQSNKRN